MICDLLPKIFLGEKFPKDAWKKHWIWMMCEMMTNEVYRCKVMERMSRVACKSGESHDK